MRRRSPRSFPAHSARIQGRTRQRGWRDHLRRISAAVALRQRSPASESVPRPWPVLRMSLPQQPACGEISGQVCGASCDWTKTRLDLATALVRDSGADLLCRRTEESQGNSRLRTEAPPQGPGYVRPFEPDAPLLVSTRARYFPVYEPGSLAIASGGPTPTILPPRFPPSGPRSITQSAVLMTSMLCAMTTIEPPASMRRRKAARSLLTSSKCRPVVGSSKMYSRRRLSFSPLPPERPPSRVAGCRCAANFMRWASPPDSVVADCPRRRY